MMSREYKGAANPNWRGGDVALTCLRCGAGFTVPPHRALVARFCSLACAGRHGADLIRGKRTARVERPCDFCAAPFEVYRSHVERSRFCSRACHLAWRRQRMANDGNPNWKGGRSRLPYPHDWAATSERIRERDGHRCHGLVCSGRDGRLTVHHIDFDKTHCTEDNLISLCSSCNTKANFAHAQMQFVYHLMARGDLTDNAVRHRPQLRASSVG